MSKRKSHKSQLFTCLVICVGICVLFYYLFNKQLDINNDVKLYFLSAIIQSNCALFGLLLVGIGILGNKEIPLFRKRSIYLSYKTVNILIFMIIILSVISILLKTYFILILFIASMEIFVVFLILIAINELINTLKKIEEDKDTAKKIEEKEKNKYLF